MRPGLRLFLSAALVGLPAAGCGPHGGGADHPPPPSARSAPRPEAASPPPAAPVAATGAPGDARGTTSRAPLATYLGEASYYSDALAGRKTASGERYDPAALTAAHRRLPFGTRLRVVRIDDGRSVEVRVNDRGPFAGARRIVDLSRAAAEQLDMLKRGVVKVRVEVLELGAGRARGR